MSEIVLTTFDWVPQLPRGFVRDLRVRWALEEAGLPYRVNSVPFRERNAEHFAHQPFGQVPWIMDGELSIFESGAILLHIGERSAKLLPHDARERSEALQWLFAALNSVEMASLPWGLFRLMQFPPESAPYQFMDNWTTARLKHVEAILAQREWLAHSFSIADIAMTDVLRLVDRFEGLAQYPACKRYVERAVARPGFMKALADQMEHFAAADKAEGSVI